MFTRFLVPCALLVSTSLSAITIDGGNYTLDISNASTMGWSASGDYARFGMGTSPYHPSNVAARFFGGYPPSTQYLEQTRSLTANLQADAGKIFDKVYVALTPGGFQNYESGVFSQSTWTVGGGTWVGDSGHYYDNGWASNYDWNVTGPSSGESTFYDGYWYRGVYETWGGFWGTPLPLTGYYSVGSSSLSLDLSIFAWVYNSSYWGASFDPPGLEFHFTFVDAPAGSVPDTGTTALCVVIAFAFLGATRRFRPSLNRIH